MHWWKSYPLNRIVFFLLALFLTNRCIPDDAPTDQELKSNFLTNRETFKEFVTLFINHKDLNTIEYYSAGYLDRVFFDKPSAATNAKDFNHKKIINNMKNILKVDLISDYYFKTDEKNLEISFYSYRVGIGGGMTKGISYFMRGNPKVIEENLDQYSLSKHKQFPPEVVRVYSKIGDGWYLFFGIY